MTVLQTNIPVISQTIFLSLVNDEQIPGHSVVSMCVRHTAVHVFVCGREQHIHYTAAVRRKALQQESVLSHQLVASNAHTHTYTHTHVHTRKLCFAAWCRKQVKYCTLKNKENLGDNPDSRKMWTLGKTSIQQSVIVCQRFFIFTQLKDDIFHVLPGKAQLLTSKDEASFTNILHGGPTFLESGSYAHDVSHWSCSPTVCCAR